MAEATEKTLFFIKSPIANITAIEQFLKKRGFNVVSESDLKVAILQIMKTAPDYILISWDHPSERIIHLPKLILQSVMTTIIAYCTSNDKLQIRKLQGSGQPLKLFPPLSGPAIQRLISRLEKDKEASNATSDSAKKNENQKNSAASNMIQVKSGFKNEELDNFMKDLPENSDQQGQISSEVYLDKGKRAADLRNFQKGHKNKSHFINPQDTNNLMSANNNIQTASEAQSSHNFQPLTEFQSGSTLFEQQDQNGNDLLQLQSQSSTTSLVIPPIAPKLSEQTKNRLNLKFDEQVKIPIEEMIETLIDSEQNDQFSQLKNETLEKTKNGFCIVVEHTTWSGYLIVASEDGLDPSSLEMLLTNWITENLEPDPDTSAQLILNCFNIKLYDIPFEKFSAELADYTQTTMLNSKKTVISFFGIAQEVLSLQLHELHDMFEIMTSEIPISMPLPFDINLYLPENRKFLLYSKPNTVFAAVQLERMREKRVEKLYATLEYESAIQKFRAENRIRFMAEKFKAQQRKQSP